MTDLLLTTKLRPPPLRPSLVPRERLVAELDRALACQVGLVSAPAGFGKTTLVAAWARRCPLPVAWLALDAADNDLTRFLAYVVAAFEPARLNVGQAMLDGLRTSHLPPLPGLLQPLINDIEGADTDLVLILDDYHLIETPAIHDALTYLIDHQPQKLHLVIATRADPPLPIARLRGRGQLVELRQADLRFTREEAQAFLGPVPGTRLSADQVEVLAARTEGWAAGLQMAAASLRHTADTEAFVRAFAGTYRHILDYLGEEVLKRQPPDVQRFLLCTSILDQLCAPLCDAILTGEQRGLMREDQDRPFGHQPSAAILDYLDHANLFVTPLDEQRQWYRYHALFADLLRHQLEQSEPEHVPVLHSRASLWYESHGLPAAATRHALAAGDLDRAAQLAERDVLAMFDRGEVSSLSGWLNALPTEAVHARPWLSVARAWTLVYAGPLEALEPVLNHAERGRAGLAPEGQRRLAGHLGAIRAYAGWLRGDGAHAAQQATEALARLPERDVLARALAAAALGAALYDEGDLAASIQASELSIAISQAGRATHVTLLASANLAYAQQLKGQLRAAAATCRRVLDPGPAGRDDLPLPAAGSVSAVLSTVLLEWNDLAGAEEYARRGLSLGEHWGHQDTIAVSSTYLATILAAAGDASGALHAVAQAGEAASSLSPWYCRLTQAADARVHLMLGDVETAGRWAQASKLPAGNTIHFQEWSIYRTLVLVLEAQGRPAEALEVLARLLALAETAGANGLWIQFRVLQALALRAQGRLPEAVAALEAPLALGEPEGYVRSFVAGGAPAAELLRAAKARGLAPGYVSRLLAAGSPSDGTPGPRGAATKRELWPETLTDREREILGLMADGCSNREIGERLFLAPGTVKSYTYRLYDKLGVHSRTQALARARELELL
jgi:LuxR family maltose regulon positive regulatory protein